MTSILSWAAVPFLTRFGSGPISPRVLLRGLHPVLRARVLTLTRGCHVTHRPLRTTSRVSWASRGTLLHFRLHSAFRLLRVPPSWLHSRGGRLIGEGTQEESDSSLSLAEEDVTEDVDGVAEDVSAIPSSSWEAIPSSSDARPISFPTAGLTKSRSK